jgi:TldD protein
MDEKIRKKFRRLKDFMSKKCDFYFDIFYENKKKVMISTDKVNNSIENGENVGVKIRIWNSKFFEFGTTNLDYKYLETETLKLIKKAKQYSCKNVVELNFNKEKLKEDFVCKISEKIEFEDKVKRIIEIKEELLKLDNDLVNVRVVFRQTIEENLFLNSYKELFQIIPISVFALIGFVKTNEGTKQVFEAKGGDDFKIVKKYLIMKKEFVNGIRNVKIAKRLKGEKYDCLLNPKISGLLAHESFGHGMEADTLCKNRALASKYFGKKIGNNEINIVDYGNILKKHGSIFFDCDGNLSSKTYLVKKGVVFSPIADLQSRTKLQVKKSCNSRQENFSHKSYVRMTNTYFEKGSKTKEELLSSIQNGIYITSSSGGMEDPKSWGVQIQDCFGQRIKNGKLVNEFYDGFTITGFLLDIIGNINGVSNKVEIEDIGHCGKGHKEWVRVASGGPYLKIDDLTLG